MSDILIKICTAKRGLVEKTKAVCPVSNLERQVSLLKPPRRFTKALKNSLISGSFGLISEIKKASPSRGLIRKEFKPAELAVSYMLGGTTCLSVLTDIPYFQGANEDLELVRSVVDLPIVRKDFIIDPYQILESRAIGADCVLLIMAAVTDKLAKNLYQTAKELDLDVLVEVHDEDEMQRALLLGPDLIGINNRNLKTLAVDLSITERLAPMAPKDVILVSESGIYKNEDLQRISASGVKCFLVGESLMRQSDVEKAVKNLLTDNTPQCESA